MLYGAQFMLAAAYTLLKGGHIRTDVLYERWSPRTRATVDAVCYVLFFFPGMLCILYAGAVEARQAWEISERTGLPIVGVGVPMDALKALIPLTAALLVLQALAELIRCGRAMRSRGRCARSCWASSCSAPSSSRSSWDSPSRSRCCFSHWPSATRRSATSSST